MVWYYWVPAVALTDQDALDRFVFVTMFSHSATQQNGLSLSLPRKPQNTSDHLGRLNPAEEKILIKRNQGGSQSFKNTQNQI